jgi:ParB-like chromosome segregation protein Spo0J
MGYLDTVPVSQIGVSQRKLHRDYVQELVESAHPDDWEPIEISRSFRHKTKPFVVVDGHHRCKAVRLLGLETVSCPYLYPYE